MQETRCQMTTQKGVQCQRNACQGGFCTQHTTCSVCLSAMSQGLTRKLPCHHTFHSGCIDRWKQTSSTCPMCRMPFDQPKYKVSVSIQNVASEQIIRDSYITSNIEQILNTFNITHEIQSRYVTDIYFDIGMNEFLEDVFREIGVRLPSAIEQGLFSPPQP